MLIEILTLSVLQYNKNMIGGTFIAKDITKELTLWF